MDAIRNRITFNKKTKQHTYKNTHTDVTKDTQNVEPLTPAHKKQNDTCQSLSSFCVGFRAFYIRFERTTALPLSFFCLFFQRIRISGTALNRPYFGSRVFFLPCRLWFSIMVVKNIFHGTWKVRHSCGEQRNGTQSTNHISKGSLNPGAPGNKSCLNP